MSDKLSSADSEPKSLTPRMTMVPGTLSNAILSCHSSQPFSEEEDRGMTGSANDTPATGDSGRIGGGPRGLGLSFEARFPSERVSSLWESLDGEERVDSPCPREEPEVGTGTTGFSTLSLSLSNREAEGEDAPSKPEKTSTRAPPS